jgi:hypothetical protein
MPFLGVAFDKENPVGFEAADEEEGLDFFSPKVIAGFLGAEEAMVELQNCRTADGRSFQRGANALDVISNRICRLTTCREVAAAVPRRTWRRVELVGFCQNQTALGGIYNV